MEEYRLKQDINIVYVEAASFPGGIKDAFTKLYNLVPDTQHRHIFGISKPQNGIIVYRAGASEKQQGEGTCLGLPAFVIKQGAYLTETLMDWQKNEMMIGGIFNRLLADKRLAGSAYCIEWYKSDNELLCMVLMQEHKLNTTIKELHI